jgi:signal transduction histidine kinase
MFSRFGLRFGMAVSYVLVSAVAVLLVEAVLLAVMVPRIRAADRNAEQARQSAAAAEVEAVQSKVKGTALETADAVGRGASKAASRASGRPDGELLAEAVADGVVAEAVRRSFAKRADDRRADSRLEWVLVVATTAGRVVASTRDDVLAQKSTLPAAAVGSSPHGGQTQVSGRAAYWASEPVETTDPAGRLRVIGIVYVVVTPQDDPADEKAGGEHGTLAAGIGSLITPGVIILILLLPVGGLFGLFSTGRLIRRIRRLADGTSAMAEGDLKARIPVSGGDEVGRLERAFNSMAERLDAALADQRRAAGTEARRAERTRIARELHDSISQDLFSVNLLAGGLRKALSPGSELRHQAQSMERSLARTMREMRAMLLELRPIDLEEAGLAEALDELCRAYGSRLGISISARIDEPLPLDAPVEHAVFRVVQEAVGNAIRHGQAESIELRVAATDGRVEVIVHDDGRGFDPLSTTGRHGLGLELMRERVGELGGTVQVVSAPEDGTSVTVLLPAGMAEARRLVSLEGTPPLPQPVRGA